MQTTQQNQLPISRRDFLTTGMLFFLFSLTLYINRGGSFGLSTWWHAPELVSTIANVITIIILIIGFIISVFCLIGSYLPTWANNTQTRLTIHQRFMVWAKPIYITFFSLAFFFNFYISWVQKLVGVAKDATVFYIVTAVGLIWVWAIVQNQNRIRRNLPTK